jgi:hypothetical protein
VPQPTVSAVALDTGRLRELSWARRLFATVQPTRRLSPAELQLAAEVKDELDFEPWLPAVLPRGYRLRDARLVPYCRTLVTFQFQGPRSRGFQLTEQLAQVSFEAQSTSGRLPSTRLRLQGRTFTVSHGAFDGTEPIDGLHWHQNRRVISWDEGNVICQLELRTGESPSAWQGLRMADSLARLTDLADGRRGT